MPKILVVDDEPNIREVIKRLLSKEGHEVIEATNGSEALEIVSYGSPDIILLDVAMPVMDGFEVLRT
ncbi:MAG: response regulator, partial [Dehalococcoidia bacterium]